MHCNHLHLVDLSLLYKHKVPHHLCATVHPTRAEYYTKAAVFYDLSIPQFECSDSDPKRIIMADKICRDLGFAYRYPNPDDMLEKRSDF